MQDVRVVSFRAIATQNNFGVVQPQCFSAYTNDIKCLRVESSFPQSELLGTRDGRMTLPTWLHPATMGCRHVGLAGGAAVMQRLHIAQ